MQALSLLPFSVSSTGRSPRVAYREVQVSRAGKCWRCHKPDTSRRCFFAPPPST